jgi:L-alanine-DL-glutamate epimerase-like enolase superfamily enzyme
MGAHIYRLLGGGVRERMPAYASGGWAPPEGTADEVLGYRAKGFKAVTIRVGGLDEPHFPQRSLERLRLAREALGPDVGLMMDAHGALTIDRAVRLGQAASEYELTWFVEPVLADDDLPGLAEDHRDCACLACLLPVERPVYLGGAQQNLKCTMRMQSAGGPPLVACTQG